MPLFLVIRKHIKEGFFPENTNNPSENELLMDLKSYPQVYLLRSLDDAEKVAEFFFHSPNVPKVGGSYGLIAEVKVEFTDVPISELLDVATIYNNWVDSQKLGYIKKEDTGVTHQCIIASSTQIKSISQTFIPPNASAYNPNLKNTDFTHSPSKCLIL